MIRQWVILAFLGLIVAVLMWNVYKDAIAYDPMRGIETKAKEGTQNGKEAIPVFEPGWRKEIIENNLFSPTRAPIKPKPVIALRDIPKRPEINLKGIIVDMSGEYIAYIEKDKAKAVGVRKGDSLDDVDVVDVKEKSIELRWNEEKIYLSLEKIKTIKR